MPSFFQKSKGLANRATQAATRAVTNMVEISALKVHVAMANLWRDNYNPLRGLTIRRAVHMLEEGERGAYAELQWTYRFIEKRDAMLRGGKRSLLGEVTGMDWEIKMTPEEMLPKGATKDQAERQRQTLRTAYDRVANIREAIEHLCLAEFRGYAHLEKRFANGGEADGAVIRLEPIEQWFMCRDGLMGEWTYNASASFGKTRGEEIPPGLLISREVEDPINEIALIAFVRKNLSQKDWDGFVETYGIPPVFAVMPQQVPSGQENLYTEIAEKVISNSRGVLPHGADIKTVDNGARGANPFRDHLRYQDEQIALAITSGLLTMLAESGSGTLAGGAHSATFRRVARALAGRISEVFQEQFDREILEAAHPGEPVLAYFDIQAEEEVDAGEFVKGVQILSTAGYQVSADQIQEKTGYEVEVKPAAPTAPAATLPGLPGASRLQNRSSSTAELANQLGVPVAWAAPVADLWQDLIRKIQDESATDADLLSYLEEAAAKSPELFGEMDIESLADLLEGALGTAALDGLRDTLRKKS